MARRKRLVKAWRRVVKREVEAAATPEAIAGAKQHLAQPQVIGRLVELIGKLIIAQQADSTPLASFLRERPEEAEEMLRRALIDEDSLRELAPTWLKLCHWAAWNRALEEMDVGQRPSEDTLKAARTLALAIADDSEHKAACLEKLTTIVARARLRLGSNASEIPRPFREAFEEEENWRT